MQQLRRLKFRLATAEAKAKAIFVKVLAVVLYGIEAAGITIAKVAQLTAAVIEVFRSRNDTHTTQIGSSLLSWVTTKKFTPARISSREERCRCAGAPAKRWSQKVGSNEY